MEFARGRRVDELPGAAVVNTDRPERVVIPRCVNARWGDVRASPPAPVGRPIEDAASRLLGGRLR